jgi:hypothetical protein
MIAQEKVSRSLAYYWLWGIFKSNSKSVTKRDTFRVKSLYLIDLDYSHTVIRKQRDTFLRTGKWAKLSRSGSKLSQVESRRLYRMVAGA